MVSMTQYGVNGTTFVGLSTDNKPTEGVPNGACFISMDNSKIFFFDATGDGTWKEWGAST